MLAPLPEDASGRPGVGVSALFWGRLVSLTPGEGASFYLVPRSSTEWGKHSLRMLFAGSVAHGAFRGGFKYLVKGHGCQLRGGSTQGELRVLPGGNLGVCGSKGSESETWAWPAWLSD